MNGIYHFLAKSWHVTGMFMGFSITVFSSRVLNFHKANPRLDRIFVALGCLYFLPTTIFSLGANLAMNLLFLIQIGVYSFVMYHCLREYWRGYKPALSYFFGVACLVLGSFITAIAYMGFLERVIWTTSGMSIGICLESSLLSLTIGWRINLHEAEIVRSQRETLNKLHHSYQQMEKVFYHHQIQLIESGKSLEQTMPTGASQACVICFDIFQSSSIRHEHVKIFFSNIFTRCHEIMSENYDPNSLRANAYRIKEMGDGFLCSVGYPFRTGGKSASETAVELAEQNACAISLASAGSQASLGV